MLSAPSFAECLLAFPFAVALHVADEWLGGFPDWARRFGSARYSDRAYLMTHAMALCGAVALAALLALLTSHWLVFGFIALWFGPGVSWNALFHVGASLRTRTHCAGVFTGAAIYMPLSVALYAAALREGLISPPGLCAALLVAGLFHTAEVGHSVFRRW
jgi:hypothetical protein